MTQLPQKVEIADNGDTKIDLEQQVDSIIAPELQGVVMAQGTPVLMNNNEFSDNQAATNQVVPVVLTNMGVIGRGQCYHAGCPNIGSYVCAARISCFTVGCGSFMCDVHRSKKWMPGQHKHIGLQNVCLDHEKQAQKKVRIAVGLPIFFTILMFLIAGFVQLYLRVLT